MQHIEKELCRVTNKGEILERVALKIIPNKAELARQMDIDRTTLYRHFADPDLDNGIILRYGKVLKHDFSIEFPDLSTFGNLLMEPLAEYRPITLSEALREADMWRDKYIDLLERHNVLLRTIVDGDKA
jgi:hypothetical protein